MVSILIATFHQFGRRVAPVRRFIICAADVEGTDGIVRGTNHVTGIEAQPRNINRVVQRRRFGGVEELAEAAPHIEPRRPQPVGREGSRNRRDHDHL